MAKIVKKTKTPAKPAAKKKSAAESKAVVEKSKSGPIPVAPKPRTTVAAANGDKRVIPSGPAKPGTTTAQTAKTAEAATAHLPSPEQVAQLAHRYWIERGRHHGSHEQDWLRAERELRGKAS